MYQFGMQLLESAYMTVTKETTVKRSWRERLLSRPWRPWKTTKIVVSQEPDPNLYRIGRTQIVGHPATIAKLKKKRAEKG